MLQLFLGNLSFDTLNIIIQFLTGKVTKLKKKIKVMYYRVSMDIKNKMYVGLQKPVNKIQ